MVSPQIPETSGDCRIILSMILMFTRIKRLSNPDRPGNEWGGIMKLNQLITTVMLVGRYDCIICLKRYLYLNFKNRYKLSKLTINMVRLHTIFIILNKVTVS